MTTAVIFLASEANKERPSCCLRDDKGFPHLWFPLGQTFLNTSIVGLHGVQDRSGSWLPSLSLRHGGLTLWRDVQEIGKPGSQISLITVDGKAPGVVCAGSNGCRPLSSHCWWRNVSTPRPCFSQSCVIIAVFLGRLGFKPQIFWV